MQRAVEHGFVANDRREVLATGEQSRLAPGTAQFIAFCFKQPEPGALFVGLASQGVDDRGQGGANLYGQFFRLPLITPEVIGLHEVVQGLAALGEFLRCEF